MWFPKLVLVLLLLCPATPALGQASPNSEKAVAAAQAAARPWLALVDAGRYAAGWDSASALLKKATTKAAWETAVRQARQSYSASEPRTLIRASYETSLPNAPPGEYVVLQYRSSKNGRAVIETITPMKEAGGAWRVSGYYIRPE